MSVDPQAPENAPSAAAGTVLDTQHAAGVRTFAEALVNVAEKDGQVDAVLGELEEFRRDVLESHPAFDGLLRSPTVSIDEKDRALARILDGRASETVARFLRVLNRHGRFNLFPAILTEAHALWIRRQNRKPVLVRSAVPLDEGQLDALRGRVAGLLGGADPILRTEVDPTLIGGLVLQVGDRLFDASVRTRLAQLKRQLVESRMRRPEALVEV